MTRANPCPSCGKTLSRIALGPAEGLPVCVECGHGLDMARKLASAQTMREHGIVAVYVSRGWPPKMIGARYAVAVKWDGESSVPVGASAREKFTPLSRMPAEDVEACERYLAEFEWQPAESAS